MSPGHRSRPRLTVAVSCGRWPGSRVIETTKVSWTVRARGSSPTSTGPDLGRKYSLERPSVTLGRSNKCDIQVDQESVSREHSKIINTGRSVRIRDLGSTN